MGYHLLQPGIGQPSPQEGSTRLGSAVLLRGHAKSQLQCRGAAVVSVFGGGGQANHPEVASASLSLVKVDCRCRARGRDEAWLERTCRTETRNRSDLCNGCFPSPPPTSPGRVPPRLRPGLLHPFPQPEPQVAHLRTRATSGQCLFPLPPMHTSAWAQPHPGC